MMILALEGALPNREGPATEARFVHGTEPYRFKPLDAGSTFMRRSTWRKQQGRLPNTAC